MPSMYTYTVATDSGLAPNPYWGWCTMAVCTPNYQNIQLHEGDWLVGFLDKSRNNRLLFAMKVEKVISRDEYFRDPTFEKKKPLMNDSWQRRCGDNMYWLDEGKWNQLKNPFHGDSFILKDTRNDRIFASKRFYYFGKNAPDLLDQHRPLVHVRGCKRFHSAALMKHFLEWLTSTFDEGVHGDPNDRELGSLCSPPRGRARGDSVC